MYESVVCGTIYHMKSWLKFYKIKVLNFFGLNRKITSDPKTNRRSVMNENKPSHTAIRAYNDVSYKNL